MCCKARVRSYHAFVYLVGNFTLTTESALLGGPPVAITTAHECKSTPDLMPYLQDQIAGPT